ncbi:MAG: hypothetical protein HY401_00040 [Elusimicrobia bacterium]|nr:hypothetical protein [Elusimicrobiota bacterium]
MKKVKDKAVDFLIAFKHFLLIGSAFLLIGVSWRLVEIKRRSDHLALVTAKILDLRFKTIQEQLALSAQLAHGKTDGDRRVLARSLTSLLEVSPYIQEAAWAGGKKEGALILERSRGVISQKNKSDMLANGFYEQSHEMGRVVISPLQYDHEKIPVFGIGYPLDGPGGGSILAKVNLWDFMKSPTEAIQELLGSGFDMEIKDFRGKLLAHKTSPESLKTFWGRFLSSRAQSDTLNFGIQVTPNRNAFKEALQPGRYFWAALVLTVILVAFL